MALTPRQQAFVEAYCGEAVFNASKAAKMAGYQGTPGSLRHQGKDNLRIPEIRAAVNERMLAMVRTGKVMSAQEVLEELTKVARIPLYVEDPRHVGDDGNPTKILNDARHIKNKNAALAVMAKHHSLLIDRVKVDLDVTQLSDQELETLIKAEG